MKRLTFIVLALALPIAFSYAAVDKNTDVSKSVQDTQDKTPAKSDPKSLRPLTADKKANPKDQANDDKKENPDDPKKELTEEDKQKLMDEVAKYLQENPNATLSDMQKLVEDTIIKLMHVESTSKPAMMDENGNITPAKINNPSGPSVGGGNQARGFSQIMDSNIPSWSKEILGESMSSSEFRNDPQAQLDITKGKIEQFIKEAQAKWPTLDSVPASAQSAYGINSEADMPKLYSNAAISKWFTGNMNSFINNPGSSDGYTTTSSYITQANNAWNKYSAGVERLRAAGGNVFATSRGV